MNDTQTGRARPRFIGDPFERLVVLLIGIVALLAVAVGYLQAVDAGHSTRAYNRGQQYALQSIGARTRGEVLAGYAWADAYRTWLTLDSQASLAENEDNSELGESYLAARDRIAGLTPLLQPPYFDEAIQDFPNLRAYESDLYIREAAALQENFLNWDAAGAAWREKSDRHVVQIILYCLVIFLLSLSLTVARRIRWVVFFLGSIFALVTTAWTIQVIVTPVNLIPEEAIQAYAQGVGLAHQQNYIRAQEVFSEAITLDPDYANALYERAKTNHLLNQWEQAAADYEAAIAAGRQDVNVYWNAGWNAYLMGDSEQAIALTEQALELSPDQLALQFNLALAYLAAGRVTEAKIVYAVGVKLAREQVAALRAEDKDPPASLWWYLDTAVVDLYNLYVCVETKECVGTPPHETIELNFQIGPTAERFQRELQSLAVVLEYPEIATDEESGNAPTVDAQVGELTFSTEGPEPVGQVLPQSPEEEPAAPLRFGMVQEQQGVAMDTSIASSGGTTERDMFVTFEYEGIRKGQLIVMKVYVNDREASGLRMVLPWERDESGEVSLPLNPGGAFSLPPGNYRVDLYIDGQFVQAGTFEIDA